MTRLSEDMSEGRLQYLLEIAEVTGRYSKCDRKQVGCVLATEDLTEFVVGVNGGPKGGHDGCLRPLEDGNCGCCHAEMNALAKRRSFHPEVAVLTLSPCEMCASLLVTAGVKHVYYLDEHSNQAGLLLLEDNGIRPTQISVEVVE